VQDPARCSAAFADLLLGHVADARGAPIARSAAAAYLASFLARAAFVPDGVLIGALERLARWCLGYCREQVRRGLGLRYWVQG
jgi:RNA polymerase I-specific transcription initiation factor RRN3